MNDSDEWLRIGLELRDDDAEVYGEAKVILRELHQRARARRTGNRMECGQLFSRSKRSAVA